MNGDIKIGKLLCDEDIITKRQLNQALQAQIKGDKRSLGEILVDRGFCSLDDITDVVMASQNGHEEHQEEIAETIEPKKENEPIELSEEKVMGTKFTMSVQTIVALATVIASAVGVYYMLLGEIEEAKELPNLESLYENEYPSRPEGHNWPRSYEQYKENVEDLQVSVDEALDLLDEYKEKIDDLEKMVTELRVQMANKKDK